MLSRHWRGVATSLVGSNGIQQPSRQMALSNAIVTWPKKCRWIEF
jgi:hypothetical protein